MDKKLFWLTVALFLSLAGNFFLGGIVIGRSVEHHPRPTMADRDSELQRALSVADRAIVKEEMEKARADFTALRGKLDAARKEVASAARAEPFDQEQLDETMRIEKEAKMALLKYIQQTRRAVAEKLSPEGQAAIARAMPSAPPRRRRPAHDEYMPFIWEESFLYGGEDTP